MPAFVLLLKSASFTDDLFHYFNMLGGLANNNKSTSQEIHMAATNQRFHKQMSTEDLVSWLREGGLGHNDCDIIKGE